MADDAIDYLNRMNQIDPNKPFFLYYVPGASHAPHHPTKEWVDKIQAMHLFDDGYEKLRERIFEKQKQLGVIPAETKLEPWPKELLKPWDELTPEEKKLFIRQVEVFAAYVAYNDHSGTGTLRVDGKDVQTIKMPHTLPMILQWDESFDIGSDTLTGVNDADYKPPFTLTAKLNKLTVKIDRPQLSPEDIKKLKTAMRNNRKSE